MAKNSTSPPPEKQLTPSEMHLAIRRLERRIADLEAFDPTKVGSRRDPRIVELEASINETLSDVFGHNTRSYRTYMAAAALDTAGLNMNGTPLRDLIEGLVRGKERSLSLIRRAARSFQEKIEDDPDYHNARAGMAMAGAAIAGYGGVAAEGITPVSPISEVVGVQGIGSVGGLHPRIRDGFPVGASTDLNPRPRVTLPSETPYPSDAAGLPQRSSSLTQAELASTRVAKTQADYETLMARVTLLEAALLPLLPISTSPNETTVGIGHNRGPSDFEPASTEELVEINQLIALLKEQGPTLPADPAPILDLQTKTSKTATKIKEYIDECGKAAAKGLGEEIGKRLAQSPFWIALYHQVGQVSEALIVWLSNLPH